jgi:hypothetical protein
MAANPLQSLNDYSDFVAELLDRPAVEHSTVAVWSASPYTGVAEGEVFFEQNYRLRMREELDFAEGLITAYGYEVYRDEERLYWYDDFPHPNDLTLAATFPHHKHIPPDIKHNRIPAAEMSYTRPNLPALLEEVEGMIEAEDQ